MASLLRAQAIVWTREASAAEVTLILGTESVTESTSFILARCGRRLSARQAASRLLGAKRQRRNNTCGKQYIPEQLQSGTHATLLEEFEPTGTDYSFWSHSSLLIQQTASAMAPICGQ